MLQTGRSSQSPITSDGPTGAYVSVTAKGERSMEHQTRQRVIADAYKAASDLLSQAAAAAKEAAEGRRRGPSEPRPRHAVEAETLPRHGHQDDHGRHRSLRTAPHAPDPHRPLETKPARGVADAIPWPNTIPKTYACASSAPSRPLCRPSRVWGDLRDCWSSTASSRPTTPCPSIRGPRKFRDQ